ncbi:RsmB/NOP family class I SAM-dependent RNA methyltransferase [soil metagenome]
MVKEQLFKSYVTTAATLVQQYNGCIPLADFLKKYFAIHKKYGSRDRKYIMHLCYCYFRLGHAFKNTTTEERIADALFLCSLASNELLQKIKPVFNANTQLSLEEKLKLLHKSSDEINNIFPWQQHLSNNIAAAAFAASHLIQPDLFIRIRPGYKQQVIKKLQTNNIIYIALENDCVALPNNTKVDDLLIINKEVVVQDYSSQRIAAFLQIIKSNISHQPSVWDCCAASGGKSILAFDTLQHIQLTVSDIRSSIINNLRNRFAAAGIKKYQSFITDLTTANYKSPAANFDLIICDAPCSGSGTWGRTPEQLYFFTEDRIEYYTSLQKSIISNIIPALKKKGYLLYITCSVFMKENEEIVQFIESNFKLHLMKQALLIGYPHKADTMFAALFLKN